MPQQMIQVSLALLHNPVVYAAPQKYQHDQKQTGTGRIRDRLPGAKPGSVDYRAAALAI